MRLDDLYDDADWCKQCQKRLPDDAYWGRRKYCSKQCRERARRGGRALLPRIGRKCSHCNGPIAEAKPVNTKFCCHDCHESHFNRMRSLKRKAARAHLRCLVCGATVEHRARLYVKYCSNRCNQRAYQARKLGAS